MAFFERTTRKGSTEKLNFSMGAADSTSNLSVREKIYLAVKKLEVNDAPPNGLSVNETFVKEMFALHVKSVDAAKDLQKKLEESNLLLALERIKCQDKEKRIQELNSDVSQLEMDLQQEKEGHERAKLALEKQTNITQQQQLKLQNYQQNRKQELLRSQHDNQQQNPKLKQQNLVSKNHSSKSNSNTNTSHSGNSKNSSENSVSQKRGRGASTTTNKPRTYRRHRNSRGPPLLSPAITPETPFRNSKSENTLERAIDQNEQSEDKEEDEDELPSDVEAGSVKKPLPILKTPVIEEDCPPLYRSSFSERPTITAASVLKSLGKNYTYDPKLIGDISNEIHQTLLNETLENESAKERAKRSRRTSSKRSRSSSSEGESKTRRCRKSRAKSDKTSKTASTQRECLFDSGNTKQLLQRLDKLCQNNKVTDKKETLESYAEKGTVTSTVTNSTKQNTFASNLSSSKNNSTPVSPPVNFCKPRGRRRKVEAEDKCTESGISTKNIIASKMPTRTITTRNSVAKNIEAEVVNVTSTSNASPSSKSAVGASPNVSFCSSPSKPPVFSSISATVSKSSTPVATAAVSKVNEPVSSAAAAIPKANSPGTSTGAVVYKTENIPSTTATTVSLVPLSPDITRSSVPKGLTSFKNSATPKSLSSAFKTPDSSIKSMSNSENKNSTPLVNSLVCASLNFLSPVKNAESSNKTIVSLNKNMTDGANNIKCESCIDDLKATNSKENICNGGTKPLASELFCKTGEFVVTSSDQMTPDKTSTATSISAGQQCTQSNVTVYNGNRIRTRNDRKSIKSENLIEEHYSSDVSLNQKENCMTTVVPYFVLESPVVVSKKKEKRPPTPKDPIGIVEVPSWREKVFNTNKLSDEEMEEDLDDAVFLKRHQRSEVDEKRRKRWDSQRMREETYLERLKRRMAQREKQAAPPSKKNKTQKSSSVSETGDESEDDMESFHPAIEDIRYIRIEDDIPIGTFGYPMPIVPKGCFDLPWSPSTTNSTGFSSPNKPISSTTGLSPSRRNGALTINGHGATMNVISCCNSSASSFSSVTSTSSGNSSAGPSYVNSSNSGSGSNCSGKNSSISTGGPSASTRLSSKR